MKNVQNYLAAEQGKFKEFTILIDLRENSKIFMVKILLSLEADFNLKHSRLKYK